jgi:hypothetical protein
MGPVGGAGRSPRGVDLNPHVTNVWSWRVMGPPKVPGGFSRDIRPWSGHSLEVDRTILPIAYINLPASDIRIIVGTMATFTVIADGRHPYTNKIGLIAQGLDPL